MDTVFILEEQLQPRIVYAPCIRQIFLFKTYRNFKGTLAVIYLTGNVIISAGLIFKGTMFL